MNDNDGVRTESSRAAMLDGLRRRFSRRWKSGIAVGVVLVGVNWVGYRLVVNDVRESVTDAESVDALRRMSEVNTALALLAFAVLGALAMLFFRPLDRTLATESEWLDDVERSQSADNGRRRFDNDLHEALEMATDEPAVTAVVEHVLSEHLPDRPAELMLADSSDSHLVLRAESPTAGAAGCGVAAPYDCPAVRRAQPLTFSDSRAVNACPKLRDREGEARSASCVPLSFMGRSMGVLHVTGPIGEPLDELASDHLVSLAAQTSTQLGTLRAFSKAQLQASTDGLTGLMNRRTAEDELGQWVVRGEMFSLAVLDLDHFKLLNDAHGHQAGDRALRLFADTVRKALRSRDLFARWGGEEFVVALPGVDRWQAVDTFDRIRLALVDACARAETPVVTASFGVLDTSVTGSLEDLVRGADEALLLAKRSGRDRVVVGPIRADEMSREMAGEAITDALIASTDEPMVGVDGSPDRGVGVDRSGSDH